MTAVVFLSYGTSLHDWDCQGILEQEVRVHREGADGLFLVAPDLDDVGILLPSGVRALFRPRWMPSIVYALLSPLVHWRTMRRSQIFHGHNGRALWAPAVARKLFGGKLTLRFGYLWSWDAIQRGVSSFRLWVALASERWACRIADRILVAAPWQAVYLKQIHGIE